MTASLRELDERRDDLADGELHGVAHLGAELRVAGLDAQQAYSTVQLGLQKAREHRHRERVRGGADAVDLLAVQPADVADAPTHLGRVYQQDEVRREATQWTGVALRRRSGGNDQPARAERVGSERLGDPQAGGVVAAQGVTDAEERDASGPIRRPALLQRPGQLRLPGPARRRPALHSSE